MDIIRISFHQSYTEFKMLMAFYLHSLIMGLKTESEMNGGMVWFE